jgi:hypothetical protein
MFTFESLIDDIAMLTYAKDLKPYMNNSQRTVYFKALGRVQTHGQKLFEAQVAKIDYELLKQRVTDFELNHPSVVK